MRLFACALLGLSLSVGATAVEISRASCQEDDRNDYWASRPAGDVKDPWASREVTASERKTARALCDAVQSADLRRRCLDGMADAKVSAGALAHCGTLRNEPSRVDCALDLRDVYYDDAAVEVCRSLTFEEDRRECLDGMKQRVLDKGSIAECRKKQAISEVRECLLKRSIRIGERLPRHNCPTRYYEASK